MTYVIDRFEGEFAVLENQDTGVMENVHTSSLPPGAKESDTLCRDTSGIFTIAPKNDDDEMNDLMSLFKD